MAAQTILCLLDMYNIVYIYIYKVLHCRHNDPGSNPAWYVPTLHDALLYVTINGDNCYYCDKPARYTCPKPSKMAHWNQNAEINHSLPPTI